jgi:hypothetical protein
MGMHWLIKASAPAAAAAAAVLLTSATTLTAAEGLDCVGIADRSARLQCYTAGSEIRATVGRVIDGDTMDICIGASCVQLDVEFRG